MQGRNVSQPSPGAHSHCSDTCGGDEMKIARQIPWRKLKAVTFILIALFIVHALWTFTGIDLTPNGQRLSKSDSLLFRPNGQILPQFLRKPEVKAPSPVCKNVLPFKTSVQNPRVISTFDLPEETDYKLNKDLRYDIPAEFYSKSKQEEPVQVILVPFSHADPGYGMTFEGYYTNRIKHALNNMVEHLTQYSNMTFQWAETVFLERWFQDITPQTKDKVRNLINNGQLEIVLGGWVMPDEASTHYQAVVDQLIEGHNWVSENLGVKPRNAWINDPFGYSSTMPYLWKKSGIENMVILRIHQAIKTTLMRKRSMDFMWRPYWSPDNNNNDILCNLMPYPGYWNSDVCGPDSEICKQFNFLHGAGVNAVTAQNVAVQAEKLYQAYKFTASLYQYKTLVVFLGEDNSYDITSAFKDTNANYGKLIQYINAKDDWKMNIKFGTITDYFKSVRQVEAVKSKQDPNLKFPTLSGDFFPYSEWENDTWTGYYTTRIWLKRYTREIEPIIRAADVFSVFVYQNCIRSGKCDNAKLQFQEILKNLRDARRNVGMFQHHDGITGTSLSFVVNDYESRLQSAFDDARKALINTLNILLTNGKFTQPLLLQDNNKKANAQDILSPKLFKLAEGAKFLIVNPVEHSREDVVSLYVDQTGITLHDETGKGIEFQLSTPFGSSDKSLSLLSFSMKLSAYEARYVSISLGENNRRNKTIQMDSSAPQDSEGELISIKNKYLTIEINPNTGYLQNIIDSKGKTTVVKAGLFKYTPGKSGAYIFGPIGPAEPIKFSSKPKIITVNGPIFSEVRVQLDQGFLQKYTLYHLDSTKGTGLFITNEISLDTNRLLHNAEVIMRFETDILNDNQFFTDQNSFQLMGRKNYPKARIETNYYPMSSMMVIEDELKRLTLHSAQSHGVASLNTGWLEVMLDRNVYKDDHKGLGTGVHERVLTLTEFVLEIQHLSANEEPSSEPRFTYPSPNSILLNEYLQSKSQVFSVDPSLDIPDISFKPTVANFPCDLTTVGMRLLTTNDYTVSGTSVVLHRKPTHCAFPDPTGTCSPNDSTFQLQSFMNMFDISQFGGSVTETSLSHLHDIGHLMFNSDLRPDASELRSFLISYD